MRQGSQDGLGCSSLSDSSLWKSWSAMSPLVEFWEIGMWGGILSQNTLHVQSLYIYGIKFEE